MSPSKGYIIAIAGHAAAIGLVVLLSAMKSQETHEDVSAQDPLLLQLWTDDGSNRDPGIPNRERGVARGSEQGDKTKRSLVTVKIKKINTEKIVKEHEARERQAEADAVRDAEEAKNTAKPVEKSSPDSTKSNKSDSVSYQDFQTAHGKAVRPGKAGKSTNVGIASGGSRGISGATVGAGDTGFGRRSGTGDNGGDGGKGDAMRLFAGDVLGKFGDIYRPLFDSRGGELSVARDSCVVRVRVSPTGRVTFDSWEKTPSDPLMESIVLESIRKMPSVMPPPSGKTEIVAFEPVGKLND